MHSIESIPFVFKQCWTHNKTYWTKVVCTPFHDTQDTTHEYIHIANLLDEKNVVL